jgi:hypothetical protein
LSNKIKFYIARPTSFAAQAKGGAGIWFLAVFAGAP